MRMNRLFLPIFIVLIIGACANTKTKVISEYDNETTTQLNKLAFTDSKLFDKELSISLKSGQDKIEIQPLDPFSLNEIPPRMDRWFVAVDKNEGKVETEDISSKKRGIFLAGSVIAIGSAIWKTLSNKKLYKPAGNYDAVLFYDDGIVERVVFTRKAEPSN